MITDVPKEINNKEIFNAVNTYKGKLTSKPISESLNLNYNSFRQNN